MHHHRHERRDRDRNLSLLVEFLFESFEYYSLFVFGVIAVHVGRELIAGRPHLVEHVVPFETIAILTLNWRLVGEILFACVGNCRVEMSNLPFLIWNIDQVLPPPCFHGFNASVSVAADCSSLSLFEVCFVKFKWVFQTIHTFFVDTLESGSLVELLDCISGWHADVLKELFGIGGTKKLFAANFGLRHKSESLSAHRLERHERNGVCGCEFNKVIGVFFKFCFVCINVE